MWAKELGHPRVPTEWVLQSSDVVSVHPPGMVCRCTESLTHVCGLSCIPDWSGASGLPRLRGRTGRTHPSSTGDGRSALQNVKKQIDLQE